MFIKLLCFPPSSMSLNHGHHMKTISINLTSFIKIVFIPYVATLPLIKSQMQTCLANVTLEVLSLILYNLNSDGLTMLSKWMTTEYQRSSCIPSSITLHWMRVGFFACFKDKLKYKLKDINFPQFSFECNTISRGNDWIWKEQFLKQDLMYLLHYPTVLS